MGSLTTTQLRNYATTQLRNYAATLRKKKQSVFRGRKTKMRHQRVRKLAHATTINPLQFRQIRAPLRCLQLSTNQRNRASRFPRAKFVHAKREERKKMTAAATHYRWNDMPKERVTDMLDRRLITGDRMMLAHVYLKKG